VARHAGTLHFTASDAFGARAQAGVDHRRVRALFHVLSLSQVTLTTPAFRTRGLSDLLTTRVTFGEDGATTVAAEFRQGDAGWLWLRSVLDHAMHRFEVLQAPRPDFTDPKGATGHVPVGFVHADHLHDVFRRTQHGLPIDDETEATATAWHQRPGAGLFAGSGLPPRSLSVGDQVRTRTAAASG